MEKVNLLRGGEVFLCVFMKDNKLFWPLYLIFVGVAALFVNFGIFPAITIRFWPLILIIPGLLMLSTFGSSGSKKD